MPYQQNNTADGYFYGADLASAVRLGLDDGCESDYTSATFDNSCSSWEMESWKNKSVKYWTSNDILHWISYVAYDIKVCPTDFMAEKFSNLDGFQMSNLTEAEFNIRDPKYGSVLYKWLQPLVIRDENLSYNPIYKNHNYTIKNEECIKAEEPTLTSLDVIKSANQQLTPPPSPKTMMPLVKKGRGRPRLPRRKKKTEKLGRLWEFLRDLLKNPNYCPSLIAWENHDEGMFRFVHSDKVAKLWGSKKENPDMNYEKLSRAMRYYYKSEVLLPVFGRRLVYKFGPTATNWRVPNPNFEK